MSDLIRRIEAMQACQACQVGPSHEWSRAKKDVYNQAATDCAMAILRVKPSPVATVGIDALAYRFWSIHPKDIPDPVGMPEGYKGGARAWMYATEIRELISAIAGGGDE